MDEYLAEAEQLIQEDQYAPVPAPRPIPQQPMYQQQPVYQQHHPSSSSTPWVLYVSIGLAFLIVTMVAVEYIRSIRNRDERNRRYNLDAYVDASLSRAKSLPHGHKVEEYSEDDVYTSSEEEEEEEEEWEK